MEEEKNKKEQEAASARSIDINKHGASSSLIHGEEVEVEIEEDVDEKEEVLVDGLTIVTCEEDSQALISAQKELESEVEELEEAKEVKEGILVDVQDLSAPRVEHYTEESEFDGDNECLEIMEHLPIVPEVSHVDFVIGDSISKEEVRLENRQEI
ncbi:unnamed protein product [Linum trigynum]